MGRYSRYSQPQTTIPDEIIRIVTEQLQSHLSDQISKTLSKEVDTLILNKLDRVAGLMLEGVEKRISEVTAEIDERIKATAASLQPIVIKINAATPPKTVEGVLPKEFKTILELASQRVNILLAGPTGCGKTYIAEKVAEALQLPFGAVSCSAGMSESQVAGWLLPTGREGQFEYQPAPFVEIYENGGVFLFDEIDSADPNMLTFINSALANGHMHIAQRLQGQKITKSKDFVCIAAANTWGIGGDAQYVGRNQLDAATLDRFAAGKVFMDYDETVEKALCDPEIIKWGYTIRNHINRHKLRRILSMRTMIFFSKMKVAYNWPKSKWNEVYFADWDADEKARVIYAVQ